ncbi:hypothetical protein TNCV_170831 [Trichonephila clavipes]|nr:hypothetical protein TNCV_170831 [Trichonephila clavipes]
MLATWRLIERCRSSYDVAPSGGGLQQSGTNLKSWPLLEKTHSTRFSQSSLDANFLPLRKFGNAKKGGNPLVPDVHYMVDALKLPNQAPRGSGESLQKCMFARCPDGTQHLFCWPILVISGQSLVSNGPVIESRNLNLVYGHVEATPNKRFLSSTTKYTVGPSWPLVLVWPSFELLHRTLTTTVFEQYCSM